MKKERSRDRERSGKDRRTRSRDRRRSRRGRSRSRRRRGKRPLSGRPGGVLAPQRAPRLQVTGEAGRGGVPDGWVPQASPTRQRLLLQPLLRVGGQKAQ